MFELFESHGHIYAPVVKIGFFTEWKFSISAYIWDLFTGICIIRYVFFFP